MTGKKIPQWSECAGIHSLINSDGKILGTIKALENNPYSNWFLWFVNANGMVIPHGGFKDFETTKYVCEVLVGMRVPSEIISYRVVSPSTPSGNDVITQGSTNENGHTSLCMCKECTQIHMDEMRAFETELSAIFKKELGR